jgi:hypothetical protein
MSDGTITDNQRRHFIGVNLIDLTLAPAANLLLNRSAKGCCRYWGLRNV